jgi:peptidoglycan hydrolase-like protein with peptidoglycan-binding domain
VLLLVQLFPFKTHAASVWVERTSSGERSWNFITSSSDGTKLAASVDGGYIYTSSDSGISWNQITSAGSRNWKSITSSSDGTKLAAAVSFGYIYTSTNSGVSWTEQTSTGQRFWNSITSSSDGTKLAAVNSNSGYIYTSSDSGDTWTERISSGQRLWNSITSSSDGTKLAATVSSGYIYTSSDSGASWTEQTSAGSRNWKSITSSSDGTKLAASVSPGYIYISSDSGATWTEQTSAGSRHWFSITSSSDGTKLAAVSFSPGYIYTYAPDDTEPTVSLYEPAEESIVSGSSVSLMASASDSSGIVGVQFKLDTNTNIEAEDTTPTDEVYDVVWDSTTASEGAHTLIAVARDTAGNYATSTVVNVTVANATIPTITTSPASSVTTTGATLNAEITATGGVDAIESGFTYGTASDLSTTMATSTLGAQTGTATFDEAITGLTCATTYYYRAYATNSAGTGYGSIVDFTTSACPVVEEEEEEVVRKTGSVARRQTIITPTAITPVTTGIPPVPFSPPNTNSTTLAHVFSINLSLHTRSTDVLSIQKLLNALGYTVATTGPGSPGQETMYFGLLTYNALIKFQRDYGIPATGFFGPMTRAVVNGF